MGSCSQGNSRKSLLFKDCGCGCNGTKQEKKFLISIISGLTFFVIANPATYRTMRKILGNRIASVNGSPTTVGLMLHSVVFLLVVWAMMNVPGTEQYESEMPQPEIMNESPRPPPVVEDVPKMDAEPPQPTPSMVVADEDGEDTEEIAVPTLPPLEDAQPVIPMQVQSQFGLIYDPSRIRFDLQFEDMVDDTIIGEGIAFNPTTPRELSNPIRLPEVTSESLAGLAAYDFDAGEIDPVKAVNVDETAVAVDDANDAIVDENDDMQDDVADVKLSETSPEIQA